MDDYVPAGSHIPEISLMGIKGKQIGRYHGCSFPWVWLMSVTMLREKAIMEGGEKMPAKVHMSKKELDDLIEAGGKAGKGERY